MLFVRPVISILPFSILPFFYLAPPTFFLVWRFPFLVLPLSTAPFSNILSYHRLSRYVYQPLVILISLYFPFCFSIYFSFYFSLQSFFAFFLFCAFNILLVIPEKTSLYGEYSSRKFVGHRTRGRVLHTETSTDTHDHTEEIEGRGGQKREIQRHGRRSRSGL